MAKQRPSVHKRQREHLKRQRDLRKAEKLERRRERRLNRDQQESGTPPETADVDLGAPPDNTDPVE